MEILVLLAVIGGVLQAFCFIFVISLGLLPPWQEGTIGDLTAHIKAGRLAIRATGSLVVCILCGIVVSLESGNGYLWVLMIAIIYAIMLAAAWGRLMGYVQQCELRRLELADAEGILPLPEGDVGE